MASVPGVALRVFVLGAHGGGDHGGLGFPVQTEPAVQLVADAERIVEVEGDERGRNVPGEAFDHDADLPHLGFDVVGGRETEVRLVRHQTRPAIPPRAEVVALRARLPDAWFWDGSGTSPYLGMLALARHIVVTEDSVSMTSEAIATGKPVYAARLAGGGWPSSNRRCARTGYCAPSTDDSPSGNTGRSTRPRASRPRSTVGLETLTDYRTGTRPQGPIQTMCRMFVAPGVPKGARALTVAGEYR